jgi:hypothetical protein
MPMRDRLDFCIPPESPHGWYGAIFGAGDGEAWTITVYWTGEERSNHPSLALSRFSFPTEEEARGWLEKQPD